MYLTDADLQVLYMKKLSSTAGSWPVHAVMFDRVNFHAYFFFLQLRGKLRQYSQTVVYEHLYIAGIYFIPFCADENDVEPRKKRKNRWGWGVLAYEQLKPEKAGLSDKPIKSFFIHSERAKVRKREDVYMYAKTIAKTRIRERKMPETWRGIKDCSRGHVKS